jgi:hypothetical protein
MGNLEWPHDFSLAGKSELGFVGKYPLISLASEPVIL